MPSPRRARGGAGARAGARRGTTRPVLTTEVETTLTRGDRGARRARRRAPRAGRRRARLRRARHRQDDLRPRRLPGARRHAAGDEPDLHDRPPLRRAACRSRTSTSTASPACPRPTGARSSRTSTARSRSSSGPRRRRASLPAPRLRVRLRHVDETRRAGSCSMAMLTLAFDTATDVATSALVRDGEVLGERTGRAVSVLADADELLRAAGVAPARPRPARRRHRPGELHRRADRPRRRARARARARPAGRRRLDARRARRRRARRGAGDRRPPAARSSPSLAATSGARHRTCSKWTSGRMYVGDGAVRYRELIEAAGGVVPPDDERAPPPAGALPRGARRARAGRPSSSSRSTSAPPTRRCRRDRDPRLQLRDLTAIEEIERRRLPDAVVALDVRGRARRSRRRSASAPSTTSRLARAT